MKGLMFYIVFTFMHLCIMAKGATGEAPAVLLTKFHFRQLSGGIILITGRFNEIKDSLNFILDSGSGGISLDSSSCEELNIKHSPSGKTINGIAGTRAVDFTKNNTLKLPGLNIKNLDFYINNYEILSSVYGEKIDGIIGYSFFSRYIVKVDFDSLYIEIYSPGSILYPTEGLLLHPLFTTLPIQLLQIKDSRIILENFYFDTGAGLCFLISKEFAQDSGVLLKRRIPVPIQTEGLGGKKRMLITIIKEVKIGNYRFKRVPTHILDDEFNATSYPYIGGLIGNDILRRFNLVINYQKKEIHLAPNSHFNESFDYSYTGMSIYNIDGKIMIDDIIKGSPAYLAGFEKDDIVMGIGNNLTNNITQYRNLFQSSGEKLKVIISRNKKLVIISFRVGRIF